MKAEKIKVVKFEKLKTDKIKVQKVKLIILVAWNAHNFVPTLDRN